MSENTISSNHFDWIPFYNTFAKSLLPYRNNHASLISGIKEAYSSATIKLPTLNNNNEDINHIDPFTVMGLFNKTGMKDDKRLLIIKSLADTFHIDAPLPTRFDGIPVLNPLNATYYPFNEINNDDLFDKLWDLFETALQYADTHDDALRPKLSKLITFAINTKYNGNSKITMALYWLSPETYINLDSRNEWYIYESGKFPVVNSFYLPNMKGIELTGELYFNILNAVKTLLPKLGFKGFSDLSYEAWRYSEEVNAMEKGKEQANIGSGLADNNVQIRRYWIYSPGSSASKWEEFYRKGIMAIGWHELGNLNQYASREAIREAMKKIFGEEYNYKMNSLGTWEFSHVLKPGDIVFAKKGTGIVVGRGIVTSTYEYDPSVDEQYPHILHINWTHNEEKPHPGKAATKTLTEITYYTDYVAKLESLYQSDEEEDPPEIETIYPAYTQKDFLQDVYMDKEDLYTLSTLLKKKKNIILQGAPGVGKTFTAKRLAYALMGEKNQDRVMMVQFHQNYSYEDFIEGFRPSSEGNQFVIKKGSFYQFCRKAGDDLDNDYYFIIDEINRGNMSRIFGELFMLIEADKRGNSLQLLYSDEKFSVPGNVYIIGTMNTADRSLALLDYALRRRFAFFEMKPGFESTGFRNYREVLNNNKFNKLIAQVSALNETIAKDDCLGEGFCIGHSYFCDLKEITDGVLHDIIEYEIAPLLREYWYDEKGKAEDAIAGLKDAIK